MLSIPRILKSFQPFTGSTYQRALQIPLVAPNILKSTDSVSDSSDHDPIQFGSSDGNYVLYWLHSTLQ